MSTLIFGMQKPFFIMGSFSGTSDNNSDLRTKGECITTYHWVIDESINISISLL